MLDHTVRAAATAMTICKELVAFNVVGAEAGRPYGESGTSIASGAIIAEDLSQVDPQI